MNRRSFASLALLVVAGCTGDDQAPGGTASGDRFFLPTGDVGANTSPPTIEVDAQGNTHLVYPSYAFGGAYYAQCDGDCGDAGDMDVVQFDTDGNTVHTMQLALTRTGQPRLLMTTTSQVIYGECNADCGDPNRWTVTPIIAHPGNREVTGEALALDPQGRPRFLMHTYIALFGIGQDTPMTEWVACDANCTTASSWTVTKISDQIWSRNSLEIDATGRAHLATVALVEDEARATLDMAAYQTCPGNCGADTAWSGPAVGPAYESMTDAVSIAPRTALALDELGHPRLVTMQDVADAPKLVYYECNADDCSADTAWTGIIVSDNIELAEGFDLAVDAAGKPNIALNLDYNIGIWSCDLADCTSDGAEWTLTGVEGGAQLPTDDIFLYPNCSIGAWLLHSPSIALSAEGAPRVAYSARDVSGTGPVITDPSGPPCTAGTDMILGRMAVLD